MYCIPRRHTGSTIKLLPVPNSELPNAPVPIQSKPEWSAKELASSVRNIRKGCSLRGRGSETRASKTMPELQHQGGASRTWCRSWGAPCMHPSCDCRRVLSQLTHGPQNSTGNCPNSVYRKSTAWQTPTRCDFSQAFARSSGFSFRIICCLFPCLGDCADACGTHYYLRKP